MNEQPHPLALRLVELARPKASASPKTVRALIVGGGNGRNVPPLLNAGLRVDILEENSERATALAERFLDSSRVRIVPTEAELQPGYIAVLSTHGFLHGTEDRITALVACLSNLIAPQGDLLLTLGSTRDPRCGQGARVAQRTWSPLSGAEVGVPHTYYDEIGVRALLSPFALLDLQESQVAEMVGAWAHAQHEASKMVHWIVHALRVQPSAFEVGDESGSGRGFHGARR